MAIQLPATCTTARRSSSLTSRACWDSNIRVEGSSRPARICCQSSGRLAELLGSTLTGAGAGIGATADATVVVTAGAIGGATSGATAGAAAEIGWAAATGSASRPNSSTSSHRRGLTLWRSCCSLPLSWACHCSRRALPRERARSGRAWRNWGDTLVSSRRSGAVPASTRSRSRLTSPCSTAAGSRPRSSSSRQPSSRARGSQLARAPARASSSCSGTAPSSSHTAVASIGAGSRLS